MACVYWPSRSAARAARSIPWSTSGGGGPEPGPGGAEGGIGGGGGRGRPGARARRGGAGAVRRGGDRRGLLLVAGAQARVVLVGDVPRVVLELELAEGAQRGPLLLLELLAGIHGGRQERAAALAAPGPRPGPAPPPPRPAPLSAAPPRAAAASTAGARP